MHILKIALEAVGVIALGILCLAGLVVCLIEHDAEDGENPFQ